MHKLKLIRTEQTEEATIGSLVADGKTICHCLENPWLFNWKNKSCIPDGRYPLVMEFSPSKGRELLTIKEVPNRTHIRIHAGNTIDNTDGCPLTGTKPGYLNGKRAVHGSRNALDELMEAVKGWTFPAEIEVKTVV